MTKRSAEDMTFRLPLVVILGATGSGKTKLSLDLAKKFGGEIIGADSMQIYKGLDIVTAKATVEERRQASHHMIDILEPHETYTVIDYRNKAVSIIDKLFSQNKLPIVVGGTNYYIESLLWKILIENERTSKEINGESSTNEDHDLPSPELHKRLKLLDPEMADRLHPNNKRKILRSLEVLQQKGRKHSEILQEQQSADGGSYLGGPLRYPKSVILWLQCEQKILDERLDKRVDSMMDQGLINELKNFHEAYNENRLNKQEKPDYTKGIFQSIGLKEFHEFLTSGKPNDSDANKALEEGVGKLKMVTRRYARKQCRWITNRFLGHCNRQVPPVYGLRTDDVSKWDEDVTQPAFKIIESFISDSKCKLEPLPNQSIASNPNSEDTTFSCDVCNRIFVGKFQWTLHMKSNRHKRVLARSKNKSTLKAS